MKALRGVPLVSALNARLAVRLAESDVQVHTRQKTNQDGPGKHVREEAGAENARD